MCNINKKTQKKSVVVYKVCRKMMDGNYYAYFSGMKIETGLVKNMPFFFPKRAKNTHPFITYPKGDYSQFYNKNIVGKTSGFELLKIAKEFLKDTNPRTSNVILKLTLGGDIMKGTGDRIVRNPIVNGAIVYAGTEILNVEVVYTNQDKIKKQLAKKLKELNTK